MSGAGASAEFRVSVILFDGPDFYVRFEDKGEPLSEARYNACSEFILKVHRDGFLTHGGQIYPVSKVKLMKVVEYVPLSTPNPAGAGSRTALSYGNGAAAIRRMLKEKAEAALPLDRNGR